MQSPKSQPAKPGSKQNKTENSKQKAQAKQESTAKSPQKSPSKDTGHGVPSAPKLDKATPYEFISAWNALKKSESVKPYYDLLKQVKPEDIKTGK